MPETEIAKKWRDSAGFTRFANVRSRTVNPYVVGSSPTARAKICRPSPGAVFLFGFVSPVAGSIICLCRTVNFHSLSNRNKKRPGIPSFFIRSSLSRP